MFPENPASPRFQSISVFHFGASDKSCPIRSLKQCVERWEPILLHSLMVLPEGFNVLDGYTAGIATQASAKDSLLEISREYGIAFIAGLIEDEPAQGCSLPFNSAYLLDSASPGQCQLIARKAKDCKAGLCEGSRTTIDGGPLVYRGLSMATLICNDFMNCRGDHIDQFLAQPEWVEPNRVLCVPAASTCLSALRETAKQWPPEICVAAANSASDDSLIVGGGFEAQELPARVPGLPYPRNRILLTHVRR